MMRQRDEDRVYAMAIQYRQTLKLIRCFFAPNILHVISHPWLGLFTCEEARKSGKHRICYSPIVHYTSLTRKSSEALSRDSKKSEDRLPHLSFSFYSSHCPKISRIIIML